MARRTGFTYIDLFAGIGGFHAALSGLGGKCVYASEIDQKAASIYELNWGINPLGDITDDANDEQVVVGDHDVLVAGFPCQPFSKSGAQRGMDETRGTLFWNILKIVEARRPAFILLENVRNLAGPRHSHEWQVIIETLREAGYRVCETPAVFSPHLLPLDRGGRPQVRERVFITAVRVDGDHSLDADETPFAHQPVDGWDPQHWFLKTDLPLDEQSEDVSTRLTKVELHWIEAWNEFVELMWEEREGRRLPGFPLWGDAWVDVKDLEIASGTPAWKADFLRKNAEFYTEHKKTINKWARKWGFYTDRFPASRRKFEWQAQDAPNLWSTVMHFRPSGIRAKRPTYLPALVAITQTSIIGSERRRLSTREAARLQGLPEWFTFGDQDAPSTYRQLGNGVSVGVVWYVMKRAVMQNEEILKKTCPGLVKAVNSAPMNPDEVFMKGPVR
jgi:DNA (cytosine-5)-methyltransferase 1